MGSSCNNFGLVHVFMMMILVASVVHESAAQNSTCVRAGLNCETGTDCCSTTCRRFEAVPPKGRRPGRPAFGRCACNPPGSSDRCVSDGDCCTGSRCSGSTCVVCSLLGKSCNSDSPCCRSNNFCSNLTGLCTFCRALGVTCSKNSDCCPPFGCAMVNGTNSGTCRILSVPIPELSAQISKPGL